MTRSGFGPESSANKFELAAARQVPSAAQKFRREIVTGLFKTIRKLICSVLRSPQFSNASPRLCAREKAMGIGFGAEDKVLAVLLSASEEFPNLDGS